MFGVTILGNNSAVPAYNRHPTCQIITIGNEIMMVDCGEGAQIQMMQYKIRRSRISNIFISHLHGDHYFGLVGLVTSFGLLGRTQDLNIFAPGNLKEIIELQLRAGDVHLPYKLTITEITESGILIQSIKIKVTCFKTNHRITCYGFKFEEIKNPRKVLNEKCIQFEVPLSYYERIQMGMDYIRKDGLVVKNDWVSDAHKAGKKYAFCADTKYDETILPHIENVDLMYHETTYPGNFNEKAFERFHSTTTQAATMALKAKTSKLIIGHFSSKYENILFFEEEARSVFPNTEIAMEGVTFIV